MGLLLLVVSGALLLILALSLCLLFIPVVVQCAVSRTPGSTYALLQASWGCIGARARAEGPASRLEWLFLDRPVRTQPLGGGETPGGEPAEELVPSSLLPRVRAFVRLIRPLSSFGGRFLSSISLEEIRGQVQVGLGDPVETGVIFGWYCALLPLLRGNRIELSVRPVFDRQVLDGEIRARLRINRPLLILAAAAGLWLDPGVRTAFSKLRGGGAA